MTKLALMLVLVQGVVALKIQDVAQNKALPCFPHCREQGIKVGIDNNAWCRGHPIECREQKAAAAQPTGEEMDVLELPGITPSQSDGQVDFNSDEPLPAPNDIAPVSEVSAKAAEAPGGGSNTLAALEGLKNGIAADITAAWEGIKHVFTWDHSCATPTCT